MAACRPLPRGVGQSNSGSFDDFFVCGKSFVEELEDLFLLLLIGVSTDLAIKCLKVTWPRRTACPRCYSSALHMTNQCFSTN